MKPKPYARSLDELITYVLTSRGDFVWQQDAKRLAAALLNARTNLKTLEVLDMTRATLGEMTVMVRDLAADGLREQEGCPWRPPSL